MLDMLLDMIRGRKKPKHAPVEDVSSKRKEAARRISAELLSLKETVTDTNVRVKSKEFYALVKHAFKESLSLKYEATFQEIADEIDRSKHYAAQLRDEVTDFLDDVGMMEYGYQEFKQLLEAKRHDKERLLHEYISELEKQGEHMKKDTKKKISSIVSDSIPHTDREYLFKVMERFRELVREIF